MRMSVAHNSMRGQSSLEYLLLLAVVAVVVIASFRPGGLLSQVGNSSQGYYNSVTRVIMGENPTPIDGHWCAVATPPAGSSGFHVMYRLCACPQPAFGGKYCRSGNVECGAGQQCDGAKVTFPGVTPCGPCPTGEVCNAAGKCVCSSGLDCSSIPNSSPDSTCTQCLCDSGSIWNANQSACVYCTSVNGHCTLPNSTGTTCSPITCPTNMNCDATKNACQCNQYTYWNGTGCVYCTSANGVCTVPSFDGKSCVPTQCAANMYCNVAQNACQCIAGYTYTTGPGCIPDTCGTLPSNASKCTNAPAPTGSSVPYTLVAACDTTTACEATCNSGYEINNGVCVSTTCPQQTISYTGTDPYNKNKTLKITVTFPKTSDGSSVSEPCGTSKNSTGKSICWKGNPIDTCNYGKWATPSGSCAPETCTGECKSSKTADGPLCTVTFPANTANGSQMTEFCPVNCAGGSVTDTCNNGAWGAVKGACLATCPSQTVGSGTCKVTLPSGTVSGGTASETCPTNCTGGPVKGTCTNGTWSVSGSCLAACPSQTVGSGACKVTLPSGTVSGGTATETCPTNCTGGSVKGTCTNGTWSVSGSCLATCSSQTVGSGTCQVTLPSGTNSGTTVSEICPTSCKGGPVKATCNNGTWGGIRGRCR